MKISYIFDRILTGKLSKVLAIFSVVIFLFFQSGLVSARNPSVVSNDREVLKLNPDYKLKRLSTGTVIIYSNKENGEVVRHEFENVYADILLGAIRRQSIDQLIPVLSRKYYFGEDECRREIKHAVHVLEEWNILVSQAIKPL